MKERLSYILGAITVLTFLVGGVTSYNKLQAQSEIAGEKIKKLEEKVSEVDKENTALDKTVGEFSVEQKYIRAGVQDIKDSLKELVKEIKKERTP